MGMSIPRTPAEFLAALESRRPEEVRQAFCVLVSQIRHRCPDLLAARPGGVADAEDLAQTYLEHLLSKRERLLLVGIWSWRGMMKDLRRCMRDAATSSLEDHPSPYLTHLWNKLGDVLRSGGSFADEKKGFARRYRLRRIPAGSGSCDLEALAERLPSIPSVANVTRGRSARGGQAARLAPVSRGLVRDQRKRASDARGVGSCDVCVAASAVSTHRGVCLSTSCGRRRDRLCRGGRPASSGRRFSL